MGVGGTAGGVSSGGVGGWSDAEGSLVGGVGGGRAMEFAGVFGAGSVVGADGRRANQAVMPASTKTPAARRREERRDIKKVRKLLAYAPKVQWGLRRARLKSKREEDVDFTGEGGVGGIEWFEEEVAFADGVAGAGGNFFLEKNALEGDRAALGGRWRFLEGE